MAFTISPTMQLIIPGVGTESGPEYATEINNSLSIIDQHDHTIGRGAAITPDAISINKSLTMNNQSLTSIAALTLTAQTADAVPASIYEKGVDLYYRDGAGNVIRITQSGSVTGASGTITGLPSGTASASYGSGTFVFQSATLTPANIDAGSYIFRNNVASSKGLTLSPPTAMAADYSLTLPPVPATTLPMVLDNAGNMGTMQLDRTQLIADIIESLIPAGTILAYGTNSTVPSGYIICDGSSISRSTYFRLFGVVGTTWGEGDGSTTFNIPDLRGTFLRGVSGISGYDPDANSRFARFTGGLTGNQAGSYQNSAFQSHSHALNDPGHGHVTQHIMRDSGNTAVTPVSGVFVQNPTNNNGGTLTLGTSISSTNITMSPNGQSSETRAINAYVNFMIKY